MFPEFSVDEVEAAKQSVMNRQSDANSAVPATSNSIYNSWLRSYDVLGPATEIKNVPTVDEDLLDNSVLEALHEPLAGFAQSLDGTGVGLLLADAQGRILDRWADRKTGYEHLDGVGSIRGADLSESTVGTNGVGTPLVTREITQITANEHYADIYNSAICTGAPLFHPISKSVIGAVTLSCDSGSHRPLLKALITSLTSTLDQHLIDLEKPSTRQMFDFFLRYGQKHPSPVVGFNSQGVLLQNHEALKLSPIDMKIIHQAARSANSRGEATTETTFGKVLLKVRHFDEGEKSLVLITPEKRAASYGFISGRAISPLVGSSSEWRNYLRELTRLRRTGKPLLLWGEKGAGKTSLAIGSPYRRKQSFPGIEVLDVAAIPLVGTRQWFTQLEVLIRGTKRIIIRNVDMLDSLNHEALRYLVTEISKPERITFVASDIGQRKAHTLAMGLQAQATEVPPLRQHPNDVNALWKHFATTNHHGKKLVLSPAALTTLQRFAWDGNIKELEMTVAYVADYKMAPGEVSVEDLPEEFCKDNFPGLIEVAEEEALHQALQQAGGNRTKAAQILGVSRATIYRKIKSYGVEH